MKKGRAYILTYPLTILAVLLCAHWGSYAVSTFSETKAIPRNACIIIDPGHGGVDGGATSCSGIPESQYNLEISLRLKDLLHLLGFETKLIRESDVSVYTKGETIAQKKISDLKERVRIANETQNAVLLSIHQNYFSDPRYNGAQVFYGSAENSQPLAKQLQTFLSTALDPNNRRKAKKSSGVYLMDHANCTSVLIECGFLSNPAEEAMLRTSAYQKKLCAVIGTTVHSFLSNT